MAALCASQGWISSLARQLALELMSRNLRRGREHAVLPANADSAQRVAAFLIGVRQPATGKHLSDGMLLPMTRFEIASFLGLKLETVRRALSRAQRLGHVEVRGHTIGVMDIRDLNQLAGADGRSSGASRYRADTEFASASAANPLSSFQPFRSKS